MSNIYIKSYDNFVIRGYNICNSWNLTIFNIFISWSLVNFSVGSNIRFFVDGAQVGSNTANTTDISNSSQDLRIGASNAGGMHQNLTYI